RNVAQRRGSSGRNGTAATCVGRLRTRIWIIGEMPRGQAKSGASNVSSKQDPILLLEPSNLLEPLSLEDRYADLAVPRLDREEIAPRGTARPIRRQPTVARSPRANLRWRLKAALLVAGGLACFAGAAMPLLPNLGFRAA